jgi:hypothetical protein
VFQRKPRRVRKTGPDLHNQSLADGLPGDRQPATMTEQAFAGYLEMIEKPAKPIKPNKPSAQK